MAADDMHNNTDYASPDTPPTQTQSASKPALPSQWPAVVGLVAIIYAAMVILRIGSSMLAEFQSQPPAGDVATPSPSVSPLLIAHALLSISLAAILLGCGIGLFKRLPCAAKWSTRWAVFYIIYTAAGFALDFYAQLEHITLTAGIIAKFLVLPLIWACAFPIFLLIWFSRAEIKDEVAQWCNSVTEAPAAPPTQE